MAVVIVHPLTGESVTMLIAGKYRTTGVTTEDPVKQVRGWLVPQDPDSDDDGDIELPPLVGSGETSEDGFWSLDFAGIESGKVYHLLVTDENDVRDMEGEITFTNAVEVTEAKKRKASKAKAEVS